MKIRGSDHRGPINPADETPPAKVPSSRSSFDELLDRSEAGAVDKTIATKATINDTASRYRAIDPAVLRSFIEQLRTGQLSATDVADKLLQNTIEKRGAVLTERHRADLAHALSKLLEQDPWLAGQVERLRQDASE